MPADICTLEQSDWKRGWRSQQVLAELTRRCTLLTCRKDCASPSRYVRSFFGVLPAREYFYVRYLVVNGPPPIRNGKGGQVLGKSMKCRPRHADCAYLCLTDSTSTRRSAVLRTVFGQCRCRSSDPPPLSPPPPLRNTLFNPARSSRSEQKFQVLVGRSRIFPTIQSPHPTQTFSARR